MLRQVFPALDYVVFDERLTIASTGTEVDCIVERDGWLHPIEIKLTS